MTTFTTATPGDVIDNWLVVEADDESISLSYHKIHKANEEGVYTLHTVSISDKDVYIDLVILKNDDKLFVDHAHFRFAFIWHKNATLEDIIIIVNQNEG